MLTDYTHSEHRDSHPQDPVREKQSEEQWMSILECPQRNPNIGDQARPPHEFHS